MGAHGVVGLYIALNYQKSMQNLPLTRIASTSIVNCEQVKSAHAKLGARAKKDGVGGSFVNIFCFKPTFSHCQNAECLCKNACY